MHSRLVRNGDGARRKRWESPAIVTLIVVAVVASMLGCRESSTTVSSAPSAPTAVVAEAPIQTPAPAPANVVGDIVDAGDFEVGVAGGTMLADGSALAVQVYVKDTGGADLSEFAYGGLRVEDGSGASVDGDIGTIIMAGLPYLEASGLAEGDCTAGWVGFPLVLPTDDLILFVTTSNGSAELEISLAGLTEASKTSPAARAFVTGSAAAAQVEDARTVTMAEYQQVKNGQTLKAVQQNVGFNGEESSSSGNYAMWSWANSDGGNMIVTFKNGKVVSKAQAGLD